VPTTFEYGLGRLREFQVESADGADPFVRGKESRLLLNGRPVRTGHRFWHSLQMRFAFTANIFKYFAPAEVFRRISERAADDRVRWVLEHDGSTADPKLLAVSNPKAGVIEHDELGGLLRRHRARSVAYHDGVVRSTHAPRHASPFTISGDGFEAQYVIETPVDGFGKPNVYLALLRQICSNGAVAMTPAFRSELNVGRGGATATFALVRALEGFNNEEGFVALRQRFEASTKSWASVYEATRLGRALVGMVGGRELPAKVKGGDGASEAGGSVLSAYHRLTGDLTGIYGLANMDALSAKRQRTLPTGCRVYDLLNFASELATHHATPAGGRRLQAFIGELVSCEYDLENTVEQFADWRDFFLPGSSEKVKGRRK
jgi:hypothetical protein